MHRTFASLFALAAAGALASAAHAQCVTVDPVIIPQIRVDPLDASGSAELVQPFYLTFRRAAVGSDPVTVRYQIVDEDSAGIARVGLSQGPMVQWATQDSPRDIGAFRNEAYALMRTGVVTLGQDDAATQRQATLRLSDLRADLPAGVYREQFTVRFWCEDGETAIPFESAGVVGVSVAIPNVLSANLAGASLRGEVDFMDFEQRERALQVNVRSTGPYRVTARSANGGVMLRDGATAAASARSDRIAYTATFGGEPLDLSSGGSRSLPRAGLAGRQMPLDLRVEEVSENRAGAYADTLFITLEPVN